MRGLAKIALILAVVAVGQVGFDVAAAASAYPNVLASGTDPTMAREAAVAAEVEARLARCNVASRWLAARLMSVGAD